MGLAHALPKIHSKEIAEPPVHKVVFGSMGLYVPTDLLICLFQMRIHI